MMSNTAKDRMGLQSEAKRVPRKNRNREPTFPDEGDANRQGSHNDARMQPGIKPAKSSFHAFGSTIRGKDNEDRGRTGGISDPKVPLPRQRPANSCIADRQPISGIANAREHKPRCDDAPETAAKPSVQSVETASPTWHPRDPPGPLRKRARSKTA